MNWDQFVLFVACVFMVLFWHSCLLQFFFIKICRVFRKDGSLFSRKKSFYYLRMRKDNNFSWVCLYVCVCVCVSVSLSPLTFELLFKTTSFLVYRYILTISRSSLSNKLIGSRSRSNEKLTFFTKPLLSL